MCIGGLEVGDNYKVSISESFVSSLMKCLGRESTHNIVVGTLPQGEWGFEALPIQVKFTTPSQCGFHKGEKRKKGKKENERTQIFSRLLQHVMLDLQP